MNLSLENKEREKVKKGDTLKVHSPIATQKSTKGDEIFEKNAKTKNG